MDIKLGNLMEGTAIIDAACMVQEANQYAETLKDYFLDKAEHITKALAGYNGETQHCSKTYGINNPSTDDIMDALDALRKVLHYISNKDERFETAVTLELQHSSKGETMEELNDTILNRHIELLGIAELLTLKDQTPGLFCPEFTELFQRYGAER